MRKLVKSILRVLLGNAYRPLMKEMKFRIRKIKGGYFALNGLDKKLSRYLDYDDGYFVELGANDGITQSNTYYFELNKNWIGVLIEPSPHNYLACREYRGKNNHVFCNACVADGFGEKYVDMAYADLWSVSENIDIDIKDPDQFLEAGKKFLPLSHDVFRFGALAATLTSLLDQANSPKIIDLLSLDVEGAELEVLKGIDFSRYRFKYMIIECRNIERLESFLNKNSYSLIEKLSHHDYLFSETQH